ncbi:MAG: class I SAM-dependent methyltransferase [Anaerolineae bacterium]
MTPRVTDYYTGYVRKEWRRLIRDPYHRLEFDTTLHFLKKHFPKKGLLLDAGGGPGRYTVTLASQGYDLILLDLTPANLEFAKRQIKRSGVGDRVKDVVEGSIVDLSRFDDNTFNGVLCLGKDALSHADL